MCDGVITASVDVTFDLVWRHGTDDTVVATAMKHFDPLPDGAFSAQACDIAMPGTAIEWSDGDQLVFRYSGEGSTSANGYIANGDGKLTHGRIPNISLP
ncbi:MAG TPA: hypothetical protein VGM90_32525 [Kofleriaceae bacterium]